MAQPKVIHVTDKNTNWLYELPTGDIQCVDTEYDQSTKVVYIHNPKYIPKSESVFPYVTSATYIALTELDYKVVK